MWRSWTCSIRPTAQRRRRPSWALTPGRAEAGAAQPSAAGVVGEVVRVDLRVLLPLVGQLVLGEARIDRAGLHAGVAVDALLGIDVEHLGSVIAGLVGRRVDAVHGAHLDAGVVLGADARLGDHVGHSLLSVGRLGGDPGGETLIVRIMLL